MNPDQVLLKRFLTHPHSPLVIDSNPLAIALKAQLLGYDDGRLRIGFEPGREFLQGTGAVQGGIVATMLDFAAAFASLARLADGQTAVTASMAVSYQAAVRPVPLVAIGIVERAGRRLIFSRAQLEDAKDRALLASATAVMSVIDAERKRAHRAGS
jgi:uncharacterized protein (TIGR00369 family)